MKKLIITFCFIAGISTLLAQNTTIEHNIKELTTKAKQSTKGEKLKWLDSLSKITKFKPELKYDSIVKATIHLAKSIDSTNLALFHTSNLIYFQNNTLKKPDLAIQIFESFILKKENFPNAQFLAKFYLNGSDSYYTNKNYNKSIQIINKSLEIYKNLNDIEAISNCYYKLGRIYYVISSFDRSLYNFFESLKINEQLNNETEIAKNLERIGKIYMITPDANIDLPKARMHINRALEIYKKLNDEKGIIFTLTNLGAINLKEGINHDNEEKIVTAIEIFKDALLRSEKLGLEKNQAIMLGNIGPSLRILGKNKESLEYLFQALEIKLRLKDYTSAAHSCNDISETYIAMNDLQNAKKYALKAANLANGVSPNQERYAYYLLSEIRYNLGEYKKSNNDLKQYHKLADSIFSQEKIAKINEMQIKYETEKKSLLIKAQESDIALLNEKHKVKNQWLLFGGTGLISFFGFVLLIRSRNKAKQKQQLQTQFSQDLIQSQEDERNRIAKELHDSIGQQLTLIKKKLQNTSQEDITILTNNTLEEVRSISRGLYPSLLKQLGLSESIEQLIYEYDEETDLFFSLEIEDINSFFNETESLNFYRFIQECVTNTVKHSEATSVSLTIKKEQGNITTILTDNGKGFDINGKLISNSLGLKTISERIKILNGTLLIDSKPRKGTIITAKTPI